MDAPSPQSLLLRQSLLPSIKEDVLCGDSTWVLSPGSEANNRV